MVFEFISRSPVETEALGAAIGRLVHVGDVVAMIGELGAGKTQLVRGLAQGMGLESDEISSPTFVMVQEYESPKQPTALIHIDAYRLNDWRDLETIGWDRSFPEMREDAVVAIEWADRLTQTPDGDMLVLHLTHVDELTRAIVIQPHGRWLRELELLKSALKKPSPASLPCPICRKTVAKNEDCFPFCSPRCRTIDLGKWADGSYVITRRIEENDLDQSDS